MSGCILVRSPEARTQRCMLKVTLYVDVCCQLCDDKTRQREEKRREEKGREKKRREKKGREGKGISRQNMGNNIPPQSREGK